MADLTFPPVIPSKLQGKLVTEIVDADTIKIKLADGTVLKTLTRIEYLSLFPSITPSQG